MNQQCYDSATLREFLCGGIRSKKQLNSVDQHLQQCEQCLSRLESVNIESDTLLETIRKMKGDPHPMKIDQIH